MTTLSDIKAFMNHCKDIAVELNNKDGLFDRVSIDANGEVYCVFDDYSDYTYTIDISDYIDTPISELRAKRAESERLEQEQIAKYQATIARIKEMSERNEYERLKAKYENT
jgi:cell division protein ZapA (FtsZ GTPase activity inhibitor)